MKKLPVSVAAMAAMIATHALAAGPTPAPSWAGLYIGGNGGGVSEYANGTSDFQEPTRGTVNPQINAFNPGNFIGGGQIGFNWQIDPHLVVGLEGDWDFTRTGYNFCRQTDVASRACFDNGDGFETVASTTDWLATVRGRIGLVTTANLLLYGTGGAAWGHVKTTVGVNCLVNGCGASTTQLAASASFSNDKSGWVAGLGAALQITGNWSARLEWLHIDLGNITNSLNLTGANSGIGGGAPFPQTAVWSRHERYEVIRVGLDYRFATP